ncbi:ABC transporter substrate-binding protein [Ferdinandcohnia quinoae]|uniref:ABC transporter substrate-binding protein n=1 Tax=Fredinandcohnia quinoae TaxID=2918902 RepID=A0AAW5E5Q9_9BACI|nr:ABC transporter substrate-binding protein [Fredinandcohnia sp. SECRCQ15]MCH1625222.1 ABC transporter substrate-binding protein [Fredinandcohnia sp. SECRCQ15]
MRKKFAFFLVLLLSLTTFLVACKDNSSDKASNDAKDKPYEIVWYTIGTPQKDTDKVFEEVSKYTKEKINATVKLKQIDWGDYDQKMQVMIASGESFDIAYTAGGNYVLNAQKGAFKDLNELLDSHGKELKAALDPAFLEGAKIDGKLYGIPSNKEVGQQSVYVFNKNLVDKHNMDISSVNSLQDLEPLLKTVKENEPNFTPIATFKPYLPFDYVLEDEMPFAFPLDGDTGKVVNIYETDVMMETLKTMHEYYKAGYIKADAATSTDPWPLEVENWFVRKEMYQPTAELLWSRGAGYDVAVQPMHDPITFNSSVTGAIQAISATSKNPEKAMEFLNLLNTDPYLRNLVDKGIEGTHYEELDNGKIKDLPARVDGYNMPSYSLGNHFILKLYENDPEDKWEKFKEFNDASTPAPTLGFYFDTNPVRTEIAAIANVSQEFAPALLTGSVDPEEYLPKANKKFKEAGLDKVLEEIQKQYDDWKKNN